jgi:UDP-N-acetylglucosamine diphosphorylase/glucosamine-1-phosphate N-acetyltransferase
MEANMPNIILFDDPLLRQQLLPFTYTRPVAAIRCGIHTISEKWERWLQTSVSFQTESYLQSQFPLITTGDNLYLNGSLCPNLELTEQLLSLPAESALCSGENEVLALRTSSQTWKPEEGVTSYSIVLYTGAFLSIRNVWDIFMNNGAQITSDFDQLIKIAKSSPITDPYTRCYNAERIFIESGANIKAAILNAEGGPIYIGRNATIQEGATIQGPFAMGESSIIAQNAKIRINTTVGPFCKIGGEVGGSVIFGYSNKGHDGYLGNSVLGEWCNLGANTNNSNLKNDHTNVKLHSYASGALEDSGLTFCGLFMGDYSKAGISTMFNTGTVVGVNVNVFGGGFQPKHIPSFSWGGKGDGFMEYRLEKALAVAQDTVSRRGLIFGENHKDILQEIFSATKSQREVMPKE